jgi:hypothetical protein
MPLEDARRSLIAIQKLPDWIRRVKELEKELAELKAKLDNRGA